MGEVIIRMAEIKDIYQIKDLFLDFMRQQQFAPVSEEEFNHTYAHLIQDKRDCSIVAEEEGKIIGFVSLTYNFSTFNAAYEATVDDIYVIPAARGKGIGKAMLERATEDAQDKAACRISILVRIEDTEARHLFEKMNFVKFERLYYRKSLQ